MLALGVFVLFFLVGLQESESTMSGLYIDNGVDQTVIEHLISSREKKELEVEFLNLLGLQEKPRVKRMTETLSSSAPKFLLDVYKSLDDTRSSRSARSEFNFSPIDLQSIDESDVIMSFESLNRHSHGLGTEKGKKLLFDLSEVTSNEFLLTAQLRLYQTANFTAPSKDSYIISAYSLQNGDELELIDSVETTADHEGWLLFNMSRPFSSWVLQPKSIPEVYVSIHKSTAPDIELHPEDLGILTETRHTDEQDKLPFMVAFMKGGASLNSTHLGTGKTRVKRQARRKKSSEFSHHRNPLRDGVWKHSERRCQIQTLFVNFRDLDWQEWIIAPDGYPAFYCSGECNFPLNSYMNATNHAVVQTLVHLINPSRVPKPCCAPTKLSPISVLYHRDTNVILKKYKNMVVTSCGCH